jgi:hypothetical protein
MDAVRDAWTDERLDDLSRRMDNGFDRVDADFRELRSEMKSGFERVDVEIRELRSQMNDGFERVDTRFDALQRTLVIGCIGFAGSLAASVIATATLT